MQTPAIETLLTSTGVRYAMMPPHAAGPAPTVLVFAWGGVKTLEMDAYNRVGTILYTRGWNLVSFDLPCHGDDQRDGEPVESQLQGWASRIGAGIDIVTDFRMRCNAVVDDLISRRVADPAHLAVAGTSRGGYMALQAAAGNPLIHHAAAFAPVTDLGVLTEFARIRDHQLVRHMALSQSVEALAGCAVWVTIGNNDERVGTDHAIAFTRDLVRAKAKARQAADVELHVTAASGHCSVPAWHDQAAVWLAGSIQ